MSESEEQRGYRIEVVVDAPREVVVRALSDPAEIGRWFGWDYEGIADEIRYIFVDHSTATERGDVWTLAGDNGQSIEVVADGPRTVVRVVQPGPLTDASWDDVYEEVAQGWHVFFQQLKHYVEQHLGQDRRTLYLEGVAPPTTVVAALDRELGGKPEFVGRFQRIVPIARYDGGLLTILANAPIDSDTPDRIQVTVTTYGLNDAQFAEARAEWLARWSARAQDPKITP